MSNISLNKINSQDYYRIRRTFGKTINSCSTRELLSFMRFRNSNGFSSKTLDAEFLASGLYCNSVKLSCNVFNKTKIPFEELLRRFYVTTTDSGKSTIENFMNLRFNSNGYFQKRFVSITKKVIPFLKPNEIIDFEELISDLSNWDNSNKVKIKWAKTLVNFEEGEV